MEDRHAGAPLKRRPLAAQLADRPLEPQHRLQGRGTHQHQHLGLDQGDLLLEPGTAGGQFQGRRLAVAGGTALHGVADVGVHVAVEAGRCQQLIQQLARTPHKGLAELVLLGPRGLTDQHQPRLGVAAAKHDLLAPLGQGATAADAALLGQRRQIGREGMALRAAVERSGRGKAAMV